MQTGPSTMFMVASAPVTLILCPKSKRTFIFSSRRNGADGGWRCPKKTSKTQIRTWTVKVKILYCIIWRRLRWDIVVFLQDETSQKILGSSFTVERSSVPERNKRLEILWQKLEAVVPASSKGSGYVWVVTGEVPSPAGPITRCFLPQIILSYHKV